MNATETKRNKRHLSEKDVRKLLTLAGQAVAPNSRLRGQGQIALKLRDRGFGIRAISRFLATHGLPVSPAAVCKYLAQHPRQPEFETANPETTQS